MEKKHSIVIFAISGLVLFAAGFLIAVTTVTPLTQSGVMFSNLVAVQVCHPDGTCEEPITVENTVTSQGLNHTRNLLSGNVSGTAGDYGINNWTFIELSDHTGSPSGDEITCPATLVTGNGLDISIADRVYFQAGSGNFTVDKVFTVTGTQNSIRKVCLTNHSTSGSNDLMASALLPNAVNVQNGDTLNITYSIAAVSS